MKQIFYFVLAASFAFSSAAQIHPLEQLINAAGQGPNATGWADLIKKTFSGKGGTAVWGQDYLFITESPVPTSISIDQQSPVAMLQIPGSDYWMRLEKMRVGVTHA